MNLKDLELLHNQLKNFNLSQPLLNNQLFDKYKTFYHLNFNNCEYHIGLFDSGKFKICGHLFLPKNYTKLVFFIHGYGDHIGLQSNFIKFCIDNNIAFACAELPGHGLSSGKRCDIRSFNKYINAIKDWHDVLTINLKNNYRDVNKTMVGYSTGGGLIFSLLQDHIFAKNFSNFICIAPLLSIPYWEVIELMLNYLPFIKIVNRYFVPNTYNEEMAHFMGYKDPQLPTKAPMTWFAAMHRWKRKFNKFRVNNTEINIFQGIDDTVVDWKYNIKEIAKKFPNNNIHLIEHAKHNLLNEIKETRDSIYHKILTLI